MIGQIGAGRTGYGSAIGKINAASSAIGKVDRGDEPSAVTLKLAVVPMQAVTETGCTLMGGNAAIFENEVDAVVGIGNSDNREDGTCAESVVGAEVGSIDGDQRSVATDDTVGGMGDHQVVVLRVTEARSGASRAAVKRINFEGGCTGESKSVRVDEIPTGVVASSAGEVIDFNNIGAASVEGDGADRRENARACTGVDAPQRS